QVRYLDSLANQEIPKVEIPSAEIAEKEAFRSRLEAICRQALANGYSGDIATISLVGFGSLVSGFATPGSDMDLAIVPAWKDPAKAASNFSQIGPEIPRLLEKALMDAKFGVRLLTKTRVPILKVCENPSEELYTALCEERRKWDDLPDEEKYPPSPSLKAQDEPPKASSDVDGQKTYPSIHHHHHHHHHHSVSGPKGPRPDTDTKAPNEAKDEAQKSVKSVGTPDSFQDSNNNGNQQTRPHHEKHWFREKVLGPLDFPKFGVGIQCDINFSNPLALHNTHLLRCYSLCDPRVRPMVLFVKSWAKRRKINSSYSGTLSSYGYVLMVLHYLVNVAYPPVCPNLQLCWRAPTNAEEFAREMRETTIEGYSVRFWRNEAEIMARARAGELTQNNQSLGALLRGFFAYFASSPGPRNPQSGYGPPSFIWTSEVLSLRTPGGILKKHAKGWTGAKSTIVNGKEVRHRYLFAIEDPFEWDHNVGRTVQHHGIVAIRDEFRRAWRILQAVAWEREPEGGLFDEVVEPAPVVKRERPRAETEM
ncbi:PAP/OAS1 substrate-binding domain-containing protein, partial [Delitschia confertaspora ATCC 74209]